MKQDNNEPTKCKNCGNLYTHKKNCMNKNKELNKSSKPDDMKNHPEIRELLNNEALE